MDGRLWDTRIADELFVCLSSPIPRETFVDVVVDGNDDDDHHVVDGVVDGNDDDDDSVVDDDGDLDVIERPSEGRGCMLLLVVNG